MIDAIGANDEGRIRYQAARRGFRVMQTRGLEHERREKAGAGTFMLLDEAAVVLFAATLADIAVFLKANDHARRHHPH